MEEWTPPFETGMDIKRYVRTKRIALTLAQGKNYKETAEAVGLSTNYFYTVMKTPIYIRLVSWWLKRVKDMLNDMADMEERKQYPQYV